MARLDRLGWAAGVTFRAYGLDVGIRANSAEVLEQATLRLPFGATVSQRTKVDVLYSLVGASSGRFGGRRYNLLYENAQRRIRTLEADALYDRLEADLRIRVAEYARGRVFVHAGVVGHAGRALLVPGRSFSGKSSLVAALVKAGAEYYSDEYAVLDGRGRVHPFAKPISLRETGETKQTHVPVEQFGGVAGSRPLPVGVVLITSFSETARWRPRRLSVGRAVLAMLEHAVPARRDPELAFRVLASVAETALTLKTKRPDADALAETILARLVQ